MELSFNTIQLLNSYDSFSSLVFNVPEEYAIPNLIVGI